MWLKSVTALLAGDFQVVGCSTIPDSGARLRQLFWWPTSIGTSVHDGYQPVILIATFIHLVPGSTQKL